MTELIKQRLVGMLIVVIAGVVFLPDLLDGKKHLTKEEFKKVPARPQIDEQPVLTEFPRAEVVAVMERTPQVQEVGAIDVEVQKAGGSEPELASNDKTAQSPEQPNASVQLPPSEAVDANKVATAKFESQVWILQLGSFKHKENVDALRKKLSDAGFDTFTKPVKTKAGLLSKVYIGPELDKATLEAAQGQLKQLIGIEGKITRFEPTK